LFTPGEHLSHAALNEAAVCGNQKRRIFDVHTWDGQFVIEIFFYVAEVYLQT